MTDNIYLIIVVSIMVTYSWRAIGVMLAARINPNGQVFEWLGCVAYAMLAGLMARVMVYPVGVLADTSLTHRAIAMASGFLFFFLFQRNFFAGTVAAITTFYALFSWSSQL